MKKLIYILAFVGIATISCEPLEETYEELDSPFSNDFAGDVELTMTDDDYADIDNEEVADNKSFASLDQAKELLPALLNDRFPALGFESTAKVNYGLNRAIPSPVVLADEAYEVTEEDYIAQGGDVANFGTFSNSDQILAFLNTKYTSPVEGFLLELTYDYFDGRKTRERTSHFNFAASAWEEVFFDLNEKDTVSPMSFTSIEEVSTFLNSKYTKAIKNSIIQLTYDFTDEDGDTDTFTRIFQFDGVNTWILKEGIPLTDQAYTDMGERFPNFSDQEEAENKLPIYLKNTFDQFAVAGDTYEFIYAVFNGSTIRSVGERLDYTYAYLIYDGTVWNLMRDAFPESLSFQHDGKVWVPDNTIKYTFTTEDYDLVVTELTGVAGFEAQVSNLDNFGNFNRNGGSTNWDDTMILAALNKVLLKNNPDAEVDQKFTVTYTVFNGSTTTEDARVILDESGEYIYQNADQ